MSTLTLQVLLCTVCDELRDFEQPPCADSHDDCPELVCVTCGSAVIGPWAGSLG
jgi:hypothetical protein